MNELERVRWRCRRGLMELEIILDRFLSEHYATLSEVEHAAFNELLTYQDADLWSLVSAETDEPGEIKSRLIALLRQC